MQFLKGDIQEGILKAAEEVFHGKGIQRNASMRENSFEGRGDGE